MIPEYFKGDAVEKQFDAVTKPTFDRINISLDQFLAEGFSSAAFLLMLYDDGRIPFSERIKRAAFVGFISEAFNRFAFIGNYDSYLFILRAIFGATSVIKFTELSPGKLGIDVNAITGLEYEAVVRSYDSAGLNTYNLTDSEGNFLVFRAIAGIQSQYELSLLFSEMMPAGLVPAITLSFYSYSNFGGDTGGVIDDMIDTFGNNIIFWQIGGS